MHSRRKNIQKPTGDDLTIEVMEPRVLLSADALGVDSSVLDRDVQH